MKLCFFDFTINFGGAPQGSLYLMKRLKDAGYDCYIIDAYGISAQYKARVAAYDLDYYVLYKEAQDVTIGHLDNKLFRVSNAIAQLPTLSKLTLKLIRYLKRIKPDIILVNNYKSLVFLNIARKFVNFKVILYFRGEGTDSQLSNRFIKALRKRTDFVITHSKLAVENLERKGLSKSHIGYIPNCIEKSKLEKPVLVNEILSSNKFKVILTAARPVKEKGHDVAIEAVYLLKLQGYSIDLFLPGSTPTGIDDSYERYLRELIAQYDLESDIHFIGWRDNLIADIASCDLVILPSHTEGFPRTIIEAMVQGIPVCATPVGGIPEAIEHMQTGILFDIGDVKGLANSIRLLIDDVDLYQDISTNAREFSREYFHPDKNTNGIINILEKIG